MQSSTANFHVSLFQKEFLKVMSMRTSAKILSLLLVMLPLPAIAQVPFDYRIVDGDTIANKAIPRRYFRIVGYDAPEVWRPRCEAELIEGTKATDLLKTLLSQPNVIWWDTKKDDRYGRRLVEVWALGSKISTLMINAKLGVPSDGKRKFNWCYYLNRRK